MKWTGWNLAKIVAAGYEARWLPEDDGNGGIIEETIEVRKSGGTWRRVGLGQEVEPHQHVLIAGWCYCGFSVIKRPD